MLHKWKKVDHFYNFFSAIPKGNDMGSAREAKILLRKFNKIKQELGCLVSILEKHCTLPNKAFIRIQELATVLEQTTQMIGK